MVSELLLNELHLFGFTTEKEDDLVDDGLEYISVGHPGATALGELLVVGKLGDTLLVDSDFGWHVVHGNGTLMVLLADILSRHSCNGLVFAIDCGDISLVCDRYSMNEDEYEHPEQWYDSTTEEKMQEAMSDGFTKSMSDLRLVVMQALLEREEIYKDFEF